MVYLFTFQAPGLLLKVLDAASRGTYGVLLVGQLILGVLQFIPEVIDGLKEVLGKGVSSRAAGGNMHPGFFAAGGKPPTAINVAFRSSWAFEISHSPFKSSTFFCNSAIATCNLPCTK
ncbi:hypothetical protein IMZ48_36460 [Candidatus Bathyarchaeota archaeon]|nr:hypothetical protein [Candidatus Bathyarchaeota archaeon]